MPINAPISCTVDIALPITPGRVEDKKVQAELDIIYQALRNLQSALNGDVFSVYRSASTQSITTGTQTKVILNAKEFDVNNTFDSVTNYRWQPNIPGYYQLDWLVDCLADAGTLTIAFSSIYKNGVIYKAGFYYRGTAITELLAPGATIVYMNGTTDYIELYAYIVGTNPVVYSGRAYTYLSGALIRR